MLAYVMYYLSIWKPAILKASMYNSITRMMNAYYRRLLSDFTMTPSVVRDPNQVTSHMDSTNRIKLSLPTSICRRDFRDNPHDVPSYQSILSNKERAWWRDGVVMIMTMMMAMNRIQIVVSILNSNIRWPSDSQRYWIPLSGLVAADRRHLLFVVHSLCHLSSLYRKNPVYHAENLLFGFEFSETEVKPISKVLESTTNKQYSRFVTNDETYLGINKSHPERLDYQSKHKLIISSFMILTL